MSLFLYNVNSSFKFIKKFSMTMNRIQYGNATPILIKQSLIKLNSNAYTSAARKYETFNTWTILVNIMLLIISNTSDYRYILICFLVDYICFN